MYFKLLPRIRQFEVVHLYTKFDFDSFFRWIQGRREYQVHRSTASRIRLCGPPDTLKTVKLTLSEDDYKLIKTYEDSAIRQQLEDWFPVSISRYFMGRRHTFPEWDLLGSLMGLGPGSDLYFDTD